MKYEITGAKPVPVIKVNRSYGSVLQNSRKNEEVSRNMNGRNIWRMLERLAYITVKRLILPTL